MIRILLIEDSIPQATLIRHLLLRPGVSLDVVPEVPDSGHGDYHVVLADLNLGRTVGLETVRAIRQVCPVTPIVVLTGNESMKLHAACLAAGASAVFVKGEQDGDVLLRSIRTVIRSEDRKLQSVRRLLRRVEVLLQPAEPAPQG